MVGHLQVGCLFGKLFRVQFLSAAEAAAPLTRMGSEVSAKRSLALALEGCSVTLPPSPMTFTRFRGKEPRKRWLGSWVMEWSLVLIQSPPSKAERTAVTRTLSPQGSETWNRDPGDFRLKGQGKMQKGLILQFERKPMPLLMEKMITRRLPDCT